MAKIDKVQEVAIERLKPYERNAKIHSEEQVRKIADSIREFGFISPCIIDGDYNLIAGHGRVEASKALGLESVPCLFVEGLTDEQRRAYILADNKLTEMGSWDKTLVSMELEELKTAGFDINLTGFSIDNILFEDIDTGEEETPEESDNEPQEPRVKKGDVWQLGKHRLMCGDSTSASDVDTLMNGEYADLLLTDPPYNVDLGGINKLKVSLHRADYKGANTDDIANDALPTDEFIDFLTKALVNANANLRAGGAFYIWYGTTSIAEFLKAMENAGLQFHENLIWVKNMLILGMNDYHWRHEPCFYGWKEGAGHYFIDMRTLDTTMNAKNISNLTREELEEAYKDLCACTNAIYEERPMKNKEHPTMKPVPLFKKLVRNSSKEGELVLDLFCGSGTTLIACEEMNRRCNAMEYEPKYADVIINRWEQLTGGKAVCLNREIE